jgi:hypothetical protein
MRYALLHPSRGRVARAREALLEWRGRSSGTHPTEYLLSVDEDDPDLPAYGGLAREQGVRLVTGRNRSLVDAANRAAGLASADLLIVVSDDFGCPERWDEALAQVVGGRLRSAVLVHDGLAGAIMTLPILGRDWYRELGYVYHPGYFSLFADDDLTFHARSLGILIDARHLVFPHRHCSAGLSPEDATYRRQNELRHYWAGWRLFERRRVVGFGARRAGLEARRRQLAIDMYYWTRTAGSRVRALWAGLLPTPLRRLECAARARALRLLGDLLRVDAPV